MRSSRAMLPIWVVVACLTVVPAVADDKISSRGRARAIQARPRSEPAPVFGASDLLAAEVLQGKNYVIEEKVPVHRYNYLFTLQTPYGTLPALGLNMLELRLREMQAVARAESVDERLTATVKDTLQQAAEHGQAALVEAAGSSLRARRGFATLAAGNLAALGRRAKGAESRQWALHIGADPETANPILLRFLERLAREKTEVPSGAPPIGGAAVSGLGLLALSGEIRQLVATKSAAEIGADVERELNDMGVWKPVSRRIGREANFTASQRLLLMHYLRRLAGVKELDAVLFGVLDADNQADGLAAIAELRLLGELHGRAPIDKIAYSGLPLAFLKDGRIVLISAADYVHDTLELRYTAASFRREYPGAPAVLLTTGQISKRAKATLRAAKIETVELARAEVVAGTPAVSARPARKSSK